MNSFYSIKELKEIGFKSIGENVMISRKASIYSANKIKIGNNVRIDDFCILSGKINLESNIHISPGVYLYGGDKGIYLENYSGISAKSIIYSITDDFSGAYMVGSMIEDEFRNVKSEKVILEKYVQLGAGTIVMPGVTLKEGVATGVNTFVNRNLESWKIYIGTPARCLKDRVKDLKKIAENLDKFIK